MTNQSRVLLLHPHNPLEGYHYPVPQVAFGYLAHSLRRIGVSQIRVLDAMLFELSPEEVEKAVLEYRPNVLGLRVWSHQVRIAEEYARRIKRALPSVKIVLGGPHITTDPAYFSRTDLFDFAVAGEAEEGFSALVARIFGLQTTEWQKMPGLIWREGEAVRMNPPSMVEDLDRFDVDWDALSLQEYHSRVPQTTAYDKRGSKSAILFMTRGCPYPCTYCAAGLTNGKKIRSHSAGRVLDQIEYLYGRYGVRHFNLMDDNFTFYKDTVLSFCEEFERRRARLPGVSFHNPNGVRVDRLDAEMIGRMKDCGWRWLHIGIESGSSATLKKMRKRLDLSVAKKNIGLIRESGLKCWGFFMIGYRDETPADIRATIDWAVSSRLNAATFSLFSPIPGTADFKELQAAGEIPDDYLMTSYMSPKSKTWSRNLSPQDLARFQRSALLRFYSRPDRAFHLLRDMSFATLWNRSRQLFFPATKATVVSAD